MSDVGCSKNQDSQAPNSGSLPQSSKSSATIATTHGHDSEVDTGSSLNNSGAALPTTPQNVYNYDNGFDNFDGTGEDHIFGNSSQSSFPLSPPPHILKRLTPLKRERTSSKSSGDSNGSSSPTRNVRKSHKSRALNATEVLEKVSKLQASNSLKIEERKQAIKEKLEKAEQKRKEVNERKSLNARRFIENSKIFGSFLQTHDDDLRDEDNDKTGNGSEAKAGFDTRAAATNSTAGEEISRANLINGFRSLNKTQLDDEPFYRLLTLSSTQIQRKIKSYLKISFFGNNHDDDPFFNPNIPLIKTFEHYNQTSDVDLKTKILLNKDLKQKLNLFLSEIGAPLLERKLGFSSDNIFLITSILVYEKCYISKAAREQGPVNYKKDYMFHSFFSTRLGGDAKKTFSGYKLPAFTQLHYYDDEFSSYLLENLEDKAIRLMGCFDELIKLDRIPEVTDVKRLKFLNAWRAYLDSFMVLCDDSCKRNLLLLYKANDILLSSLAIQEHLTDNRYSEIDLPELDKEVDDLTIELKNQRKKAVQYINNWIKQVHRYEAGYSNVVHNWFTRGFSLHGRRLYLYKEYRYQKNLVTRYHLLGCHPPSLSLFHWRRYCFILLLKKCISNYKKRKHQTIPGNLKTGRATTRKGGHFKIPENETAQHIEEVFSELGVDGFRFFYIKAATSIELKENLEPLKRDISSKSVMVMQTLAEWKVLNTTEIMRYNSSVRSIALDKDLSVEGKIERVIHSVFLVLKGHCKDHIKSKRLTNSRLDLMTRWINLHEEYERSIDVDKIGDGFQLLSLLAGWRDIMILTSDLWLNISFSGAIVGYFAALDQYYFFKGIDSFEVFIKTLRIDVLNTKVEEYIVLTSSHEESGEGPFNNPENINKDCIRYMMAKFFEYCTKSNYGLLRLKFSGTLETFNDDLVHCARMYKVLLCFLFIQISAHYFFNNAPLILTGNEMPGFDERQFTKLLVKPNMSEVGDLILKYLKEKNVEVGFSLDDNTVEDILNLYKDHMIIKIQNDPRTRDLYSHCPSPLEEIERLAKTNTVDSALSGTLKRVKYFGTTAKQFNSVIFDAVVNYSMQSTSGFMRAHITRKSYPFILQFVRQLQIIFGLNFTCFKNIYRCLYKKNRG